MYIRHIYIYIHIYMSVCLLIMRWGLLRLAEFSGRQAEGRPALGQKAPYSRAISEDAAAAARGAVPLDASLERRPRSGGGGRGGGGDPAPPWRGLKKGAACGRPEVIPPRVGSTVVAFQERSQNHVDAGYIHSGILFQTREADESRGLVKNQNVP